MSEWNPWAGNATHHIQIPPSCTTSDFPGRPVPKPHRNACVYCGRRFKFASGKDRHEKFFCPRRPVTP